MLLSRQWNYFPTALSYSTLFHAISTAATKVSRLQINGSVVKNPPVNARGVGLIPGSGRCPWRTKWPPTPVFLPGESHGQRSLAGYSPWCCKELDMTEQLSVYKHTQTHTHVNIPHGHRHRNSQQNNSKPGTSLVVQWLGLRIFTAKDRGSIPGWGTKILQVTWPKI